MTIIEETARTDLGQLRIGLLGPVRAWLDDTEVPVGPPRQQALLAVLATNANQVISRSELIDAIWGTEPPASAVGSVHTYVAGLRRALEPARKTFQVLVSAGSGYSLRVQPEGIDAERFARHRQTARQLLAGGDLEAALAELDLALGCGPARRWAASAVRSPTSSGSGWPSCALTSSRSAPTCC
ncbi:AfsR/SARP family transcriptional regulator [Kutzneria kofuensis]|uniref:AfsR/SARP family transcriptional regulator n=1 Tax=Kutzneria kofuensis TaxID=103725 RepID=UPI0031F0EA85